MKFVKTVRCLWILRAFFDRHAINIYMPLDTKYHRRLIQNAFHESLLHLRESFLLLPCFSHLILLLKKARICLVSGSIAIQKHTNSDPTLSKVSSTMYSSTFFFEDIFLGWHIRIQFQIATWLLLTLCKKNIALATPLVDNSRKYKYKARPISD